MLDRDLAELYGVATKALNQAVARNVIRFPPDFSFHLTPDEAASLRSQSVTSKGRGGRRHAPLVFTEQGVAMLSSVLRSRRAVDVNIAIMRAFVHLRELLATHKDLARKFEELERKYDGKFALVFDAIRELMAPSPEREHARPRIGFIRERASAVLAYGGGLSGSGLASVDRTPRMDTTAKHRPRNRNPASAGSANGARLYQVNGPSRS